MCLFLFFLGKDGLEYVEKGAPLEGKFLISSSTPPFFFQSGDWKAGPDFFSKEFESPFGPGEDLFFLSLSLPEIQGNVEA